MPLTPPQSQRISEAIGKKISGLCPLCMTRNWTWGPDLIVLQTQRPDTAPDAGWSALTAILGIEKAKEAQAKLDALKAMQPPQPPPPAYPLLPLMCGTCGNTMLLNVYALGIADLWPEIQAGKIG